MVKKFLEKIEIVGSVGYFATNSKFLMHTHTLWNRKKGGKYLLKVGVAPYGLGASDTEDDDDDEDLGSRDT